MGEFDCTLTPQYTAGVLSGYCVDCPEIPAQSAQPEQTFVDKRLGWNASARSAVVRSGDCFTEFTLPAVVTGVVCGVARQHVDSSPANVGHAFYVFGSAGRTYWRVMESGVVKTAPVERTGEGLFRIERRADTVRYFVNGSMVYTSTVRENEALRVVACMYAADDGVN